MEASNLPSQHRKLSEIVGHLLSDIKASHHERRKRKKLGRILKVVLLQFSLAKEMLRKKYNKEKREPCDDVAAITKGLTISSLLKEKPSSTLSSVTSSVDLASNVASSPGDERSNCNQVMVASYSTSSMGLRTFLISLGVLVFWGRACAIFCTAIWLLFYPRYHGHALCLS